jgi:excisionase family DNA binding protein
MKNICYDPRIDSDIFTTEQAAEYLGFTYKYMRQVLCTENIPSYDSAGKTRLFLKAALDAYKARKSNDSELKAQVAARPDKLKAKVWVDIPLTKMLKHKQPELKDFTWEELPKLRARIKDEYGEDLDFTVKVSNPEGGNWDIRYHPASPLENTIKKVAEKFKRK